MIDKYNSGTDGTDTLTCFSGGAIKEAKGRTRNSIQIISLKGQQTIEKQANDVIRLLKKIYTLHSIKLSDMDKARVVTLMAFGNRFKQHQIAFQ